MPTELSQQLLREFPLPGLTPKAILHRWRRLLRMGFRLDVVSGRTQGQEKILIPHSQL